MGRRQRYVAQFMTKHKQPMDIGQVLSGERAINNITVINTITVTVTSYFMPKAGLRTKK